MSERVGFEEIGDGVVEKGEPGADAADLLFEYWAMEERRIGVIGPSKFFFVFRGLKPHLTL